MRFHILARSLADLLFGLTAGCANAILVRTPDTPNTTVVVEESNDHRALGIPPG